MKLGHEVIEYNGSLHIVKRKVRKENYPVEYYKYLKVHFKVDEILQSNDFYLYCNIIDEAVLIDIDTDNSNS
jgi:hypothetical protein